MVLKLYKRKNHNTRKRMQNYFNRHSGTKKRGKAIKKEKRKSRGYFNAKISTSFVEYLDNNEFDLAITCGFLMHIAANEDKQKLIK